jgi:hypothetical protein
MANVFDCDELEILLKLVIREMSHYDLNTKEGSQGLVRYNPLKAKLDQLVADCVKGKIEDNDDSHR